VLQGSCQAQLLHLLRLQQQAWRQAVQQQQQVMLQVYCCCVSFHHLVQMLLWVMLRMTLPCWELFLRKMMQ
jgi:hypothetical protein